MSTVEFAVNSAMRNLDLSGKSSIFRPNHSSWSQSLEEWSQEFKDMQQCKFTSSSET